MRKQSLRPLPKLKREAEKWFHTYIRLRDCLKTTGTLHHGLCYVCDADCELNQLQAGHFQHNKLDFDEDNLNAECVRCNLYLSGNLGLYAIKLIKDKGQEFVDDLILRSHQQQKFSRQQLEDTIKVYKQRIINLTNQ